MKSINFLVPTLLLATLLFSSGCNKEEKDPPALRLVSRVEIYKTASGSVGNDQTVEYRYDSQNRITEMSGTVGYGNHLSFVISYPAENVMVSGDNTYALNNDGYITSISQGEKIMGTYTYTNGYVQTMESYSELMTVDNTAIPVTNTMTYTWEDG